MTPNRERVWVGLFVVIALAVLIRHSCCRLGGMGRNGVSHRTYFKFSGGVQAGTPVRYGGMRVGNGEARWNRSRRLDSHRSGPLLSMRERRLKPDSVYETFRTGASER
jgi:hypothetical protein